MPVVEKRGLDMPRWREMRRDKQEILREWFQKALEQRHPVTLKKRFTQSDIAKLLRITPSGITKLLAGRRQIFDEEIPVLSQFLGIPPPNLEEASDINHTDILPVVPVVGTIEAGIWYDHPPIDLGVEESAVLPVPIVRDAMYRGLPHYACRVQGRSMDRKIPEGSYAIWVPYERVRNELRDGDFVIVESRDAGRFEGTVKLLKKGGRGWELHPFSNDPQWQGRRGIISFPNRTREGEDKEVRIIGLVVACHTDFRF